MGKGFVGVSNAQAMISFVGSTYLHTAFSLAHIIFALSFCCGVGPLIYNSTPMDILNTAVLLGSCAYLGAVYHKKLRKVVKDEDDG